MGGGRGNLSYPRERVYPSLTTTTKPYAIRHCPDDFRERYLEMGWDGIAEHYRTNWRRICRWIDESGGQELRLARAEYVRQHGRRRLHVA